MTERNPFFSVVIPTYNRPIELERAIHSVLNQAFTDYEIIVANNGGAVNMPPDPRITLIHEARKGANYARNSGIDKARGKFICFLDDDDEYLPDHLEKLYKLIREKNETAGLYRTFSRREVNPGVYADSEIVLCDCQENRLQSAMTILITMNDVCLHHKVVEKYRFDPSVKVAQDYHLWLRILSEFPLFEVPEVTTVYHYSAQSVSSPSLEKYFSYIEVFRSLYNTPSIGNHIRSATKRDRLFRYHFWILAEYAASLKPGTFLKTLAGALYYKPGILFTSGLYKIVLGFFRYRLQNSDKQISSLRF